MTWHRQSGVRWLSALALASRWLSFADFCCSICEVEGTCNIVNMKRCFQESDKYIDDLERF